MNALYDGTPVDLDAVQADEEMLNLLLGPVAITNEELARVLLAWSRDVDSEPFPVLIEPDRKTFARRVFGAFLRLLGGGGR